MKTFKNPYNKAFGYTNSFLTIGKVRDTYIYQIKESFLIKETFYKKSSPTKVKWLNIYTMTFLSVLFSIIGFMLTPLIFAGFIPYLYFNGMYNFIKDGAWVNNGRFFVWCTFIGFILSLLYIFLT